LHIAVDKIGAVIGPGGKTIRSIIEQTGATIDVESDGRVFITTPNNEASQQAVSIIEGLTREAKLGDVFLGKVVRIMDFGAFVNILPGKDGMVHISELAEGRVENVEDVVQLGDEINVMVIGVYQSNGKISLSRRAILTGEGPTAGGNRRGGSSGPSRSGGGGGRGGFRNDRDRDPRSR